MVTLLLSQLCENADDLNEAEGIKCGVVLLGQAKGAFFPVGHLLALAHLLVEQVLADLSEA